MYDSQDADLPVKSLSPLHLECQSLELRAVPQRHHPLCPHSSLILIYFMATWTENTNEFSIRDKIKII